MRPLITAMTWGWCYLCHFSRPLGNLQNPRAQAQHYLGWAEDEAGDREGLEQRIAEHLAGHGAKITRAAVAQGIEIVVVATWRAPLAFEKVLKRRKEAPKLCALCMAAQGQRAKRACVPTQQLALPLDLADADTDPFPAPAVRSMDWYEGRMLSRMRQASARAMALGENWDEGLL
jgi:hypothetical protein